PSSSTIFPYTTLFRSRHALSVAIFVVADHTRRDRRRCQSAGFVCHASPSTSHEAFAKEVLRSTAFYHPHTGTIRILCRYKYVRRSEEHTSELQSRENL